MNIFDSLCAILWRCAAEIE